ncbi:MAG: gliding motility-associated C-terminal domain-containing protein [Bacteroidota bacterium]
MTIEFVADAPYEVFIIGPSCAPNPNWQLNPYFYLDGLDLAESNAFGIPFESITGNICEDNLVLTYPDAAGNTYQWYFNGVALIGETDPSLFLTSSATVEGDYNVTVFNGNNCSISQTYTVEIPSYSSAFSVSLCEGESFVFGPDTLTAAGDYEALFTASDGCDSLVMLDLDVRFHTEATLFDTICEGDTYTLFNLTTSEPGTYEVMGTNSVGCDSLVTLNLAEIPQNSGIELGPEVTMELGSFLNLRPLTFDPSLVSFEWYNANDVLLSQTGRLDGYQTYESTFVYLNALDGNGCPATDTLLVLVDKSNSNIYIPNVFSPNFDGVNDNFKYFGTEALGTVPRFSIFDRWGNLVFEENNILEPLAFRGWNGSYNGEEAQQGVYVYYLEVVFLDGRAENFSGSVTLMR